MRGAGLPVMNGRYRRTVGWCDQIYYVEREIVADRDRREYLESQGERDDVAAGHTRCEDKTRRHHRRVGHRIEDAVAHVTTRESLLAVVLDDRGTVLGDLPADLDAHGNKQAQASRQARRRQPEQ